MCNSRLSIPINLLLKKLTLRLLFGINLYCILRGKVVYTDLLNTFLAVSNYPAVFYLSIFNKTLYKLRIV
jgi:hypothetical protein